MRVALVRRFLLGLLPGLLWVGCQKGPQPSPTPTPLAASSEAAYRWAQNHAPKVKDEVVFYEQRAQQRPQSAPDQALLAQAYLAQAEVESGDYGKAEQAARKSLQLQPRDNGEANLVLAQVYWAQGRVKECQDLCSKLTTDEVLPLQTRCHLEFGQLEPASKLAHRWMQVEKNSTPSLVLVAKISSLRGRDDLALQLLQSALNYEQPQQRQSSAELRYLWGDLHWRHGRRQPAKEMLLISLQIQRRNPEALRALAKVEWEEGDLQSASRSLEEAYLYSGHLMLRAELGHLQKLQGNQEAAEEILGKAATTARGPALAAIRLEQGRAQEALTVLDQWIKDQPGVNWMTYQLKARIHRSLDQSKPALEAISQALGEGYAHSGLLKQAVELAQILKDPRLPEWEKQLYRL